MWLHEDDEEARMLRGDDDFDPRTPHDFGPVHLVVTVLLAALVLGGLFAFSTKANGEAIWNELPKKSCQRDLPLIEQHFPYGRYLFVYHVRQGEPIVSQYRSEHLTLEIRWRDGGDGEQPLCADAWRTLGAS